MYVLFLTLLYQSYNINTYIHTYYCWLFQSSILFCSHLFIGGDEVKQEAQHKKQK